MLGRDAAAHEFFRLCFGWLAEVGLYLLFWFGEIVEGCCQLPLKDLAEFFCETIGPGDFILGRVSIKL